MIIHWSIRLTNEMMVILIIVPREVQSENPTLDSGYPESSVGFPDWTSLGTMT